MIERRSSIFLEALLKEWTVKTNANPTPIAEDKYLYLLGARCCNSDYCHSDGHSDTCLGEGQTVGTEYSMYKQPEADRPGFH